MKTMMEDAPTMDAKMMMTMPPRRLILTAAGVLLAVVGWYVFRPELLLVNETVDEALPAAAAATTDRPAAAAPRTLSQGSFHDGAHATRGTATIHRLADGRRVLRLTEFETSNGPDVHVYLVAAADATDSETVKSAGFVDLGSLKGNLGDQNYELPADVDLQKHRAVTIWCARFGVNFGTAPLQ